MRGIPSCVRWEIAGQSAVLFLTCRAEYLIAVYMCTKTQVRLFQNKCCEAKHLFSRLFRIFEDFCQTISLFFIIVIRPYYRFLQDHGNTGYTPLPFKERCQVSTGVQVQPRGARVMDVGSGLFVEKKCFDFRPLFADSKRRNIYFTCYDTVTEFSFFDLCYIQPFRFSLIQSVSLLFSLFSFTYRFTSPSTWLSFASPCLLHSVISPSVSPSLQ